MQVPGTSDALDETMDIRIRLGVLEQTLIRIAQEIEPAFECPEVSFVALHRVACLARRSLADR